MHRSFCTGQLKIQNDFDPVLSPESSLFVLKSKKQVNIQLYTPTFPFIGDSWGADQFLVPSR
jgi:hypothetical protein